MLLRNQLVQFHCQRRFNAKSVNLGEVHRFPYCVIALISVENPVYHVLTVVVEHAGTCRNAVAKIFYSSFKSLQLLRFQILVSLVTAYRIVKLRYGRHSQRGVV